MSLEESKLTLDTYSRWETMGVIPGSVEEDLRGKLSTLTEDELIDIETIGQDVDNKLADGTFAINFDSFAGPHSVADIGMDTAIRAYLAGREAGIRSTSEDELATRRAAAMEYLGEIQRKLVGITDIT